MNKRLKEMVHRCFRNFPPYQIALGGYRFYKQGEELTPQPERFMYFGKNVYVGERILIMAPERCHIGDNSVIGTGTNINAVGGFHLGEHAILADECFVLTTEHRFVGATLLPFDNVRQVKPVHIGDYAWLGARTMVRAGVRIGEGAVVAMGSVVMRDVAPLSVVAGNPAEVIGKRSPKAFEELRDQKRGRDPFTQCPLLWVPPFIQQKHKELLDEFGLNVAPGEEYFFYDKYRGTLDRISNARAKAEFGA